MLKFSAETFSIQSDSDYRVTYTTTLAPAGAPLACSCPAGQNNTPCKHLFRAQVKQTLAFKDAAVALLETCFKSKKVFKTYFNDLACEVGVNEAIREVLDRGLSETDLRRVNHQVGDWREIIGRAS